MSRPPNLANIEIETLFFTFSTLIAHLNMIFYMQSHMLRAGRGAIIYGVCSIGFHRVGL